MGGNVIAEPVYTLTPARLPALLMGSGCVVDIPRSLPINHRQEFIQGGNQPIVFRGVVQNVDGHSRSRGIWAKVCIDIVAPGVAVLSGETA